MNSIHGIGWTPPGGQVNHSGGPQASPSGRTPLSPSVSAVSSDPSDQAPATRYQRVFVLGAEVAVTRSSGEVEHHWHLGETLPTGAVRVHSANAYKDCSAQGILNQNPGLIPQGMEFDVRRSNGAHEGGWVAEELSPEGTVVLRKGNLEKCLSVDQLVAENPDLVPPRADTTGQRVSSGSETGRLEAPGPGAPLPTGTARRAGHSRCGEATRPRWRACPRVDLVGAGPRSRAVPRHLVPCPGRAQSPGVPSLRRPASDAGVPRRAQPRAAPYGHGGRHAHPPLAALQSQRCQDRLRGLRGGPGRDGERAVLLSQQFPGDVALCLPLWLQWLDREGEWERGVDAPAHPRAEDPLRNWRMRA